MEEFDELVSSLTPRADNPAIKSYQNTTAVACPACEEPFDDLVVCKEPPTSLTLDHRMDLCTAIDGERILIFTHKK